MPTAIATKLNEEMNKALAASDVQQQFLTFGLEPTGGSGEKFRDHLKAELARWARVVKEAGIATD